jgi:FeS assembly protein IscX
VDPTKLNFVDLHNRVVDLDGFDDDHKRGGEKFLEAIQQAWIDEAE